MPGVPLKMRTARTAGTVQAEWRTPFEAPHAFARVGSHKGGAASSAVGMYLISHGERDPMNPSTPADSRFYAQPMCQQRPALLTSADRTSSSLVALTAIATDTLNLCGCDWPTITCAHEIFVDNGTDSCRLDAVLAAIQPSSDRPSAEPDSGSPWFADLIAPFAPK
jgi:hypothetical protein